MRPTTSNRKGKTSMKKTGSDLSTRVALGIGMALALAGCESAADKQQRENEEYAVSTAAMCQKTRDLSEQLEATRSLVGKPQRDVDGRKFSKTLCDIADRAAATAAKGRR
jgi:hypothetical protein